MRPSHQPTHCFFCNDPQPAYWFSKASEGGGTFPIYTCKGCGSGFVFPVPTEEELSLFYSSQNNSMASRLSAGSASDQYNEVLQQEIDFPNATIDAQRMAETLKGLSCGPRVLDVGCGYGLFSRALISSGFSVDAIELGEASRKIFAVMNGFEPDNQPFNMEFAQRNAGKYDAVLLSQVLEHLPMDTDPVKNLSVLLKQNGICVIAVPHFRSYLSVIQGKNDMFITPPEHLNFFTSKGLRESFTSHGFECIKLETVSRYNYAKLKRRFGPLSILPKILLRTFFRFSDAADRGIFINGYFRKT